MPVMLANGSAAEVTFAHSPKVTTAQPAAASTAATACKRVGRHPYASHHQGGSENRDSVQHELTFPGTRVATEVR
jgi:hypothetical protein